MTIALNSIYKCNQKAKVQTERLEQYPTIFTISPGKKFNLLELLTTVNTGQYIAVSAFLLIMFLHLIFLQ